MRYELIGIFGSGVWRLLVVALVESFLWLIRLGINSSFRRVFVVALLASFLRLILWHQVSYEWICIFGFELLKVHYNFPNNCNRFFVHSLRVSYKLIGIFGFELLKVHYNFPNNYNRFFVHSLRVSYKLIGIFWFELLKVHYNFPTTIVSSFILWGWVIN